MKIKIGPSKQGSTSLKASQFSSLNVSMIKMGKNTSKHTKSSTSHTLSSFHIGLSKQKNEKIKKTLLSSKNSKIITNKQKQSLSSCRLKKPKNKSKQKKSLDFEFENYNKLQQIQNDGGISYRQYCLVQNSFVPITTTYEHKKIDQILKSTADSTPFYEDIHHNITTRKVFPFKLKQSINSIFQQSSRTQNQNSLSNCKQIYQKQAVIIKPSPIYQQIGIQYSQRYPIQIQQLPKQLDKQKQSKVVQIDIQTDQIIMIQSKQNNNQQMSPFKAKFQQQQQVQKQQNYQIVQPYEQKKQQSLADLLLKLQFKHLSNEKSFQELSKMQKQHYSCLLNQLITKLNNSPREFPKKYKSKQKIQIQQVNFSPIQQIKVKYQKLQIQIYKRQCYQTNLMQRPFNPQESEESIDSSLLAISTFLFNFFCYVQLNYSEEFLNIIKKQYGLSYKLEYQRLTRNIKPNTKPLKVLDECLFEDFCDQTLNEVSLYEKIHLKAVFDCINDLLDTYRPFYNHHGQPFPWSFKMYHNICEYAFDQDSLEIIFGQIKQTLQNDVSNLCGIIIDQKYYTGNNQKNLLQMKRNEKQNKFIQNWLNQNTHQTKAIECQATKVLFDVSQIIYNQLLLQILNEKPFLKQNLDFQFIE